MKDIIIIEYSEEDECYIATVKGTYLSAFGETRKEALKEIEIALEMVKEIEEEEQT